MLLVLSIAFYFHYNIWGCIPDNKVHGTNMGLIWGQQSQVGPMLAPWTLLSEMCSTGPFQYRWLKGYIHNSCYYHHQIGSVHPSRCCHIFPRLCSWGVCHLMLCYSLHIHSGKTGNLFPLLLCSLWWVQKFGCILTWSCSFICTLHHLIIIIVQTFLKTLNL